MRLPYRAYSALIAIAIGSLLAGGAIAQVPQDKQSVIVFDIQLKKLRESKIYQAAGGDDILKNIDAPPGVDLKTVDRIAGSIGYPENMQSFTNMGRGQDLPIEFFVRTVFSNQQSAASVFDDFAKRSKAVDKGNKTYLYPKSDNDPQNVSICKINGTTLEMGTDLYTAESGRNFRTLALTEAWNKLPNSAIRIAADAQSAEIIVEEGVTLASQTMPPAFSAMLLPIKDIATLGLAFDVETENLVALELTGKDEQRAQGLETTLNGLLAMVKGQGQMASQQGPPEIQKIATQILGAMNFTRSGTSLTMNIPRPEGFDEAFAAAAKGARMAAQGAAQMNNMKQALLGMHNYYDTFRKLPWDAPQPTDSKDLSWRYRLLPFMEQASMYDAMDRTKGPKEAPNSEFADRMPGIYGTDGKHSNLSIILHDKMPTGFRDITDGMSNTIAMIQTPSGEPWLQGPGGISMDNAIKAIRSADSPTIVGLYDGSVRRLPNTTSENDLRAMMTYNGGETIDF